MLTPGSKGARLVSLPPPPPSRPLPHPKGQAECGAVWGSLGVQAAGGEPWALGCRGSPASPLPPNPVSTPPSLLCQRLLDPPVPWHLFQGFLFWTYPFFPEAAGRILPALGLKPLFLQGMSELVPLPESAPPFLPRVDPRRPCLLAQPVADGSSLSRSR